MNAGTRLVLTTCTAVAALLASACHEPEQPPVPPHPTNPTNTRAELTLAESETDASIVPEAGPIPPRDAGIGLFDASPVGQTVFPDAVRRKR
ncbi:MAG TPA: hypothetical protein VMI75_22400 [Polyangiaceae bacterium]|nr:hypothetical protein [Polyangiaceae bacterium]